jgi:TetR/AcrR family transcriptional regulator, transcriptional repressor for nem operon
MKLLSWFCSFAFFRPCWLTKSALVLHDVVQHLHWLLTRELLHQIVRSGKNSIATILGNGRYMLPDVRGVSHLTTAASGKKGRNGLKAALAVYVCAEHRDNPRAGCPLAGLGSELARSDKRVRDTATTGFSRMVEILAAHFDQARPAEAKKRAMATAAAMIGAVTMSRVLTDQKLSDSLLQAVEESVPRRG